MGMLKNVWDSKFVDKETKYLFFLAIPINLILWGCKIWALKVESINKLNVFIHRPVRRILGIKMQQVREEWITNKEVRERFFNIPDAKSMIAARELSYLGKMVRRWRALTTQTADSINHPRLYTNKRSIIVSLELILPPIPKKQDDATESPLEIKWWKRFVEERKQAN